MSTKQYLRLGKEYKGQQLATNDDSKEKEQVGHQWEASSQGRCVFLLALKFDNHGRNLLDQLNAKLA